jgi:hypothetical protein
LPNKNKALNSNPTATKIIVIIIIIIIQNISGLSVVVHACDPSYWGGKGRRIVV